ncbi:MAG: histone deacetylase [Candidatus Aminicenantales bacterium]|jgi:acetoin utilization deacetylase AcuC-like enzyme
MKPGVVFDHCFADHAMGPGHVESPERVRVLNRMLEEEAPGRYLRIEPRPATDAELGWVHERAYIDFLRSTAGRDEVFLDADTSAGPRTFETALLAAGGFLRAIDAVMEGRVGSAFALVRPPGHHAEASRAMGFCFFNNVAVGAEYLIRRHGLRRILIVDWDLHHGNGTQHAFYSRRDVLYFSTHQVPLFPGTGAVRETGDGPGIGYNLNVPLTAGKGDADFLRVFRKILGPVSAQFRPEFILVSAGFDICAGDPLGGMAVSREGFGLLTDALSGLAAESSAGRIAFVLEGGYDLPALRNGVREVLDRLSRPAALLPDPAVSEETRRELEPCFQVFRSYWDL